MDEVIYSPSSTPDSSPKELAPFTCPEGRTPPGMIMIQFGLGRRVHAGVSCRRSELRAMV
jgi:hypothetical protein